MHYLDLWMTCFCNQEPQLLYYAGTDTEMPPKAWTSILVYYNNYGLLFLAQISNSGEKFRHFVCLFVWKCPEC